MLHHAARNFYNPIAVDASCTPSITNCSGLVVHVGSERLAPLAAVVSLEAVRFSDGSGGRVASWPASLSPGQGAFFDVSNTAAAVAAAGCNVFADCLLLVHVADAATGADVRPPAVRSLTLWANASLPPVVVSLTALGGGVYSVTASATAPHTMVHAAEVGHFLPNDLLLLPGVAVQTTWVPATGGPAEPTGVYAVTINGGSASIVEPPGLVS